MKELEYPFDSSYIVSKKKKILNALKAEKTKRIVKKIAILGGSTTYDIKLCMELFLLNNGIEPVFFETEYNKYYEEAMFPSDELISFQPDLIYVYTTNRNITYPVFGDTTDEIDNLLDNQVNKFTSIWDNLYKIFKCPIIQNNFEKPFYRLMGNKDVSDIHGKVNFISRLNQKWNEYAQAHEYFFVCDLDYISSDYGLSKWCDTKNWYLYKYAMSMDAIPYLSFNVSNIIKSLFGKNKKGLVLDLDNTLWGGVIGDDGVDNIELGPEEAMGQAYQEFQWYLKEHTSLGVLLNIDSKNDEENALAGLKHPDSLLSPDDMIVIKANWDSKDKNLLEIASELSLLPDSLVFIDDNPAERHIVREQIDGISVPEIGEVTDYIKTIDRSGFFETTVVSSDDSKRNQMYKDNIERTKQAAKYENYSDYLLSLEMRATIRPFESVLMSRIAQLTNKSNQFNLTTKRYTQEQIEEIAKDKNKITLYGRLEDCFGDNGVVSVVIGNQYGEDCEIELWLMSCRVLKRDMEYAMMDEFVSCCKQRGINKIIGLYYPTQKNAMVKDFYKWHGFDRIKVDDIGNTTWELIVDSYKPRNNVITIE